MLWCIILNYIIIFQAKAGVVLNIIGVCVVTLATMTWGAAIFNLNEFDYSTGINATTALPITTT